MRVLFRSPGVAQAALESLGQRFFRSGRGPGIGAGIVVGDIDAGHQADSQACLRQVALKVEATAVERVESGRELLVDSGKGVPGVSRTVCGQLCQFTQGLELRTPRSAARRVGQECVGTWRSRCAADQTKKQLNPPTPPSPQ